MNTRFLMTVSALVMALVGLTCSFLPQEIAGLFSVENNAYFSLIFQLLGSVYLGFAILNWMARGNLIGGIYSKPVAIGNFMHFLVGGLALLKFFMNHQELKSLLIATLIYIIFAFCFGKVAFGAPIIKK